MLKNFVLKKYFNLYVKYVKLDIEYKQLEKEYKRLQYVIDDDFWENEKGVYL